MGGLVEGSGHRWPVLGTWLAWWVGWWRDPATGGRILALRRPSFATRAVGADAGAPGAAASAAPVHRWRGTGPPLARHRVTAGAAPARPRHAPLPAMADAKPCGPVSPPRPRHPSAVADLQRGQAVQVAMDLEFSVVSHAVQDAARPAIDQPQFEFCPHRHADAPLRRSAAPPIRGSARIRVGPCSSPSSTTVPLPCATVRCTRGSCVLVRGPYGDLRAAADDTWQARCVGTRGADSEVGRRWTGRSWWSRTTPRSVS